MINKTDEKISYLAEKLGLEPIFVNFLCGLGYDSVDSIKNFLYPPKQTPSPFCMSQMQLAVDRINQALENGEKILIFGDYDCDGICATSILKLYFDSVGADVYYYIPKREDGYGLSITSLECLIEALLPDLIVTVDCGITSIDEVEHCFDLGVDIIVTDHHEPQEVLPECVIVNPKIDQNSPLLNLCGAGVALKLVEALSDSETANQYLDIATLATVADVVPLVGANRSIVYHGLKLINKKVRPCIKTLLDSCELTTVLAEDIGFRIAPRINAPGRLCLDLDMVEFFTTEDHFVLSCVAEQLEKVNSTRQNMTKTVYEQAEQMLTASYLRENKVIVLYRPDWPVGILGLVAARLAEKYYRPVIMLTDADEVVKGSARSVDGINIFKILSKVSSYMLGFGGHAGAAGMSITKSGVKKFATAINEVLDDIPDDLFVKKHKVDLFVDKKTLTKKLCSQIALMQPTGECNPSPIFGVFADQCSMSVIPNTNHIKGRLNIETDVVGFGKDYIINIMQSGAEVVLYGSVSMKEFKNREYVQFLIDDYELRTIDCIKDNAQNFSTYLKTGLIMKELPSGANSYRITTDISKELPSDIYGTLFVTYSKDTADRFLQYMTDLGKRDFIKRVTVGVIDCNPLNTLCLLPHKYDELAKYSSIIFLDSPISSKFLMNLASQYVEPEFVLNPSFGFEDNFKRLVLSDDGIIYTARRIFEFISNGKKAKSISDMFFSLMSYGYKYSNESFFVHFYTLFEIGWLRVSAGFNLSCYATSPNFATSKFLSLVKQIQSYFNR